MTSSDKILNEALGIINPVEKAFAESAITPPKNLSVEEDVDNEGGYPFWSCLMRRNT